MSNKGKIIQVMGAPKAASKPIFSNYVTPSQ